MEWSDIDFKKKTIDVNKTLSRGDKNVVIINRPKTKKGIRTILIDDHLTKILKQYQKKDKNILQLNKDGLIFNNQGKPYNPTLTKTWLLSIYRAHPELKQISAHGFRHSHASLILKSRSPNEAGFLY